MPLNFPVPLENFQVPAVVYDLPSFIVDVPWKRAVVLSPFARVAT